MNENTIASLGAIGNVIGGVAAPIGSLISGIFTNRAQKKANQANMELAKYQYQQNLEQWNRENKYNSPAEQMKRYKAAGLNPNLIYGQQNTAASSPQYDAPHIAPVTGMAQGLGNMFHDVANSISMMLGLERQKAEIAKLGAETSAINYSNTLNNYFMEEEKAKRSRDYSFSDFLYQLNTSKYSKEWDYRKAQLASLMKILPYQTDWQIEKLVTDKNNYTALTGARIGQMETAATLNRTRNLIEQAKLPFALEMMMAQIQGQQILNVLRGKKTEQWRDIGLKIGGLNLTAGGVYDLGKGVYNYISDWFK